LNSMKAFSSRCRGSLWLPGLLLWSLTNQSLLAVVGFSVTPATVSNTYSGSLTFLITGLSSGQTVVIQKYLDANTNGVIDGADLLWQQFQLTDGQASVIGGVTNINVPGDTDITPGQITNAFTVTNATYAQSLTGNVVNNATNVPNAVVLVFRPGGNGDGPGDLVVGSVANNAGAYTVKLPAGTYAAAAFKSNYLGNLFPAPVIVGSGATVNANIVVTNATHTLSGKLADAANNALGLPGLFLHAESGQWVGVCQSDTNGNFSVRVRSGNWGIGAEGLETHGYLGVASESNSSDTTTGNVSGLVITYPQATALFYGRVTNNFGQPLAGVKIESENSDYFYYQSSFTDTNGNYVAGALANDDWDSTRTSPPARQCSTILRRCSRPIASPVTCKPAAAVPSPMSRSMPTRPSAANLTTSRRTPMPVATMC
jgi:hypothetical protein